ncbi:wings apart [Fusarium longipes]|uniref:Wings apart n=1 Tax=Fusarium longipes TaxID=694270 RepID=A0A395SGX1_9HYPO|nr:wings apart [Fusarium longipes]
MASRNGPAAPIPRKVVTYGKPSRKRFMRDAMPLRTAESFTTPTAAESVAKPSKPSLPRSTSDPSHRSPTDSRSAETSRTKAREEHKTEARDATDTRKRKRPHAASSETIDEEPSSVLQKQPNPTTALPRRPLGGTSEVDGKAAAPPRRSPTAKKSPKDNIARSRTLSRSKSDLPTTGTSPKSALPVSKDRDDELPRPKKRRPRLIDALAAQRADTDSEDSDPETENARPLSRSNSGTGNETPSQQSQSQSQSQSQNNSQNHSQDSTIWQRNRPAVALKGRRVKYTYGQSRSILSESSSKLSEPSQTRGMATTEEELDALLATPPEPINPDPFGMDSDDDMEDDDIRPAIKSVHELRRAGANNRFADEMEDLLARIGTPSSTPSSLRRSALLELSQKLQHKEFISQFRDHATRDKVAANIGQEKDVISGFALSAVLVIFLNFSPAAHLLQQLVSDGLGELLSVLLRVPEDIDELAAGKMRLSKTTRNSVGEVKKILTKLNIWHGRRPEKLSPQTLALQLLNTVCQRIDAIHSSMVVKDVENDLEIVVGNCVSANPRTDVVFALVVSILESQSGLAMNDEHEISWVGQQTHHVARLLENSLQQWPEKLGDVETATLKLSINMSNTTHGAAAFSDGVLLSSLSKAILSGFKLALDTMSNQRLKEETYDGLLLVLGMGINILEHCAPARENMAGEQLEGLVAVYLQNQALVRKVKLHNPMILMNETLTRVIKAASEENLKPGVAKLGVAFGYLSILLGYLSLVDAARQRFAEQAGSQGLPSLIGSIKEFIGMYREVDNKVTELEGLVNDLQRRQRR